MKCEDRHPNCPDFAAAGQCSANPSWMEENCKKSCESKRCDKEPVRPIGKLSRVACLLHLEIPLSLNVEKIKLLH